MITSVLLISAHQYGVAHLTLAKFMRYITFIMVLMICCSCSSIPNAHVTTRPARILLTKPLRIYFDPGPVMSEAVFDLPAGIYDFALENAGWVYYVNERDPIKKSSAKYKRDPLLRFGGIRMKKSVGAWSSFMLVTAEDLSDARAPGLALLTEDKIGGKYVWFGARIGRTDENGKLVSIDVHTEWGSPEDLSGIILEGSVPFKK
ncbi:MAG: hypothetical protein QM715_20065 [Nibricoccus sp.]